MNYSEVFKCCICGAEATCHVHYHNTPKERQIPFCEEHADKHGDLNFNDEEIEKLQAFLKKFD